MASSDPLNPPAASPAADASTFAADASTSAADASTSAAATISRAEVLRRRSLRARQQIRFLRNAHWALLEELRVRVSQYYWRFGLSPEANATDDADGPGAAVATSGRRGPDDVCAFPGCKSMPMELTSYCYQHILSDSKQTLYKPCTHVIKSGASGPVLCWKPVLRSVDPVLCSAHFQKAQRHVSQALKKAGLNTPCSDRPAPKFHVLIAEYVRQIQAKRREARKNESEFSKNKGRNND